MCKYIDDEQILHIIINQDDDIHLDVYMLQNVVHILLWHDIDDGLLLDEIYIDLHEHQIMYGVEHEHECLDSLREHEQYKIIKKLEIEHY